MSDRAVLDPDAARFEAAEARLFAWGLAFKKSAQERGVPIILSNVAETLAHVRRQTKQDARDHRKDLRKKRRRLKKQNASLDLTPEEFAEMRGYKDPEPTAKGKQTRSRQVSKLSLDTRIMEVDRLVRGLPNWAQQCVFRRYMYDQEDRPAAKELKMRVGEYTQRRRAAVELIADKLDERYIRHACR